MDGFSPGNVPPSSSMAGIVARRSFPNPAFMCIPLSIRRQNPVCGGIENESVERELDIREGANDLPDSKENCENRE